MTDWRLYALIIGAMFLIAYLRMKKKRRVYRRMPDRDFPDQWRKILEKRVRFYQRLSRTEKEKFEKEVHIFLLNYQIVGAETRVTDLDRMLVASGAVIPTFRLEKWHYTTLKKVVIHPGKFQIPETDQLARGLVGWGEMEGQMWLSRKALYEGFHKTTDNKNVAIHEFIHLMDMQDGIVDGIPETLMVESDIQQWKKLYAEKSEKKGLVDTEGLRRYAKTSLVEFLAATSEHYFENPDHLKRKHPKLYRALDKIYHPNANWF